MKNYLQTLHKEQVAVVQLRDALKLYYEGSYISAITLAGAAEELLAKCSDHAMSKLPGADVRFNHADMAVDFLALTFSSVFEPESETKSEEEKELNYLAWQEQLGYEYHRTKNHLKHKGKGQDFVKTASFIQDAEKHIGGAIINYKLYKKTLPVNEPLIMKYCEERGIS
jgi:hypothetical protein